MSQKNNFYNINNLDEGIKRKLGDQDNPLTMFEVRIKGSKIDQPEYEIEIPDQYVSSLELLGNTPLKLQLETEEKVFKSSSNKNTKVDSIVNDNDEKLEYEVKVIKEAALTKPTDNELREWYRFLKANDLYEESAWQ